MEKSTKAESILIDQARGGDTDSFSALVELYQERAIRAAWSVVGNVEDARDMAQDAFVKAYEKLSQFDGRSGFYTWFYRILLNTCKDFLRKKKLRQTFSFWFKEEGDEEESAYDPPDFSRNARDDEDGRLLGQAVYQAMDRLPDRQREVFALRYLEGMDLAMIAQTIQISEGAVKAHLWHAAQKMRQWLLPYRSQEGMK